MANRQDKQDYKTHTVMKPSDLGEVIAKLDDEINELDSLDSETFQGLIKDFKTYQEQIVKIAAIRVTNEK